uniref:Prominin 1 b n=1 Tax=Astyanax mexicanus TaxID=7994 RepID=A0A3B1IF55_ASTMX
MLWRAALALGLVLLLLPHTEPRAPLDFGLVPGGVYDTVAHYEPGPIGLLFNMVHAFLHVVQPNPFPEGKSYLPGAGGGVIIQKTNCLKE